MSDDMVLLQAINKGFQNVQDQLNGIKTDVAGLKTDVAGLKTDVAGLKTDVADVKTRLTSVEASMVTKDYLDEKLGVTNGRIASLVNVLQKKRVITEEDKRHIYI